jgi:DNA-binding CsgD family transcriptional regulator/PAS domain-containing protein
MESAQGREELEFLLDAIYDCSLRPEGWQAAIKTIARYFDVSMAGLHFFDFATGESPLGVSHGIAPAFAESLRTIYGPMWSIISGIPAFPVGEPRLIHDVIDADVFLRTRFYREWVQPQGQRWWAGWVSYRRGSRLVISSLGRREDERPFDEDDREKMRLIAPHLRRTFEISDALEVNSIQTENLSATLDTMSAAVFLCGPDGVVVHMNRAAQAMVRSGANLAITNKRLTAIDKGAALSLSAGIASATGPGIETDAATVAIAGANPAIATIVSILRGERERILRPFAASCAVFVQPARAAFELPSTAVGRLYSLTPAELRVLAVITSGASAKDTANVLGLSLNTVKTHLASLFTKTGTTRQAELTALISGMARR